MERMPSEEELLLRMIAGDETAFSGIYRHYHSSLYTYLLRFCKVPSLAEDLVHDVFLKIWEIRERINPKLSFSGYLYRIARNHVFKTIARLATDEHMREQLLLQLQATSAAHTEQVISTKEYDRLFAEALSRMPAQQLKVFRLCRQEGKSYEEAAAILGISHHTVKKHMVSSMRFIRDYIYRHGDIMVALYLVTAIG
ncbi:RNA polymerase sigma factor [Chitinophaga nivalis]|uniref:RNA polymerase sigma-70 factor n=1 Tax=Chitinophaga nivalis TaxID=2991709 RepID=A0ABT3IG85_9BACT|nr:RNA polymerase sigma-70 factor [Chitinophaga nivalis]MCW3467335.1 RNA polymerase sigma-70 factor [Chitinophaga nivalis]MCW3482973.1 RNA polymerase sigma-70 factor [Chitinophaga nivalis]